MDYLEKYKLYTELFSNLLGQKEKHLLNIYFDSLIKDAMPKGFIGNGSEEEIWLRHILDSILILQKSELVDLLAKSDIVIDLGAGAGLPGIPLSIIFPGTSFTLVEAMEKRAKYISEVKEELKLDNVTILNKRVEDVKSDDFMGNVRLVLFRAFLKPLVSLEMALRVMPSQIVGESKMIENSKVLYWRSRRFDTSGETGTIPGSKLRLINSRIRELGYKGPGFYKLECPPEMNSRGIYLIEYSGASKEGFPRSWARIKKDPLIHSVD